MTNVSIDVLTYQATFVDQHIRLSRKKNCDVTPIPFTAGLTRLLMCFSNLANDKDYEPGECNNF